MADFSWTTLIVVGVVLLLAWWAISTYNQMITGRNTMTNALEQINVVLKQRHDAVPNLVATVKGYAAHESGTLEAVVQARNAAQQAVAALANSQGLGATKRAAADSTGGNGNGNGKDGIGGDGAGGQGTGGQGIGGQGMTGASGQGLAQIAAAEGALGQAMGRLFALAESYPDLKASDNFRDLQEELTSLENKVAAARRGYNNAVLDYNNSIHVFPAVLLARMFGFQDGEELVFDDQAAIAQAPKVAF